MKSKLTENFGGSRIEVEIPEGFHHSEGTIETGYVIINDSGDEYVRIPTGDTAAGMHVRGFWISRYEISVDSDEIPHSMPRKMPVTKINYQEAIELAEKVNGCLPSKEEYNRICMWMAETRAVNYENIFERGYGNKIGNYSTPFKMQKTGSNPQWMINNIDNFWGNSYIWTTEKSELYHRYRVIRGGPSVDFDTGKNDPPVCRTWAVPEERNPLVTLRVVIHDKSEDEEE